MSVSLLDLVLATERVDREFRSSGLEEKHKIFIKDLILGKKDNESDRDFLFQIICNNETGIDVDKWDYLLRDGKQLNINVTFDPHRLMKCVRIVKVSEKYHICYRKKEQINIFHMYMMRAELHRMAYQHPVVKMIEEMWLDAMKEANSNGYSFKGLKLGEIHTNPTIYSSLTDHIFQDILCSEDEKYFQARKLLERIQTRRLYKMIHRTPLTNQDGEEKLSKIIKCTEMKRMKNPTLDLYVTSLKLEMPDLGKSVYLYDKGNLNVAKSENNWLTVPVFPYDMSQMKRFEIFHFCKKPESLISSEMKSLNERVSEILSECSDQTL
ncbi:Uncharacterized protein GBIM_04016 [Gryllus bimaculatus]|nr:Uncharacterized protein GBIM_04016 [Gryllus bimaculatus]